VTGRLPIDYCIVPNTRLGYIFFPTFLDKTIADQTREALQQMTVDGQLDGLILDNRMNGGGLGSVAHAVMNFFASGLQGYYIGRTDQEPLQLEGEDVGGSQTVPLVVLVDVDTVSYAEIVSGVLRLAGRARIVGGITLGNIEQLHAYDLVDTSRAWIASRTFQPLGQTNGIWEKTGIIPDVILPTRWDLFTEATDPALAEAVALLMPS
jgi:C-terminal processing protease CtpA/Prc